MYMGDYTQQGSARNNLGDFTIEGENSHGDDLEDEKHRNAPSYMQRDFFSVNAMGLGGSMQMFNTNYGLVGRSHHREQFRDFSLMEVVTTRKEIYPWFDVKQQSYDQGVDILALISDGENAEDSDFDNALFNTKVRKNFGNERKFGKYSNGSVVMKMRGDYAGVAGYLNETTH